MEYEGDQHSDGLCDSAITKQRKDQEVPSVIESSIRSDVPCPATMLVAVMNRGSYLLVAYPQGEPAAFVVEEADLLKQILAGAFAKHGDERAAGVNDSGTPERGTAAAKQVQP
ncbi:MAG: hypothetical protein ACRDTA_14215 [Pseudonocardiaceae bacterium]